MKNLLLVVLTCCCNYLSAQNFSPVAIEDKKMDAYLTGRVPATLTIQIKNLPDSVKKVNIKYTLAQLKDTERDNFLDKIDLIIPPATKTDIWEYNHSLITRAVSNYMSSNGAMPTKSQIAQQTGLSRQTVAQHFKEHKRHPAAAAEMEQFKFMVPNMLANVFKLALKGDIRAARLYFEVAGVIGQQQTNTVTNEQNNYIQINNTILSQENLKQLSAGQLNRIEKIITNNKSGGLVKKNGAQFKPAIKGISSEICLDED